MTISRGTVGGGGMTRLGSNCLLMAGVHIGHDSQVGSHCILANCATLAGHVIIEDYATVGAFCPVHQHCIVGKYAFIGGGTIVTQDVLPFSLTSSRRENKAFGINKIGLERRGFSPERLQVLQKAFRLLLAAKLNTTQALEKIKELEGEDVALLVGVHRTQRARGDQVAMKLGLIAGNGRFPFLLLDAARAQGLAVVVAAIREETDPEIDQRAAADERITVHWLSLGELSRLIETFHKEGVSKAVMAGQVKHKQIFSSIRPDWRLAKLLLNLRTRTTDMLLGAVAKVLGDEGIELISSTAFLEPLLAAGGRADRARAGRGRAQEHRVRAERGARRGRLRHWADGGGGGAGLRGRRGDGRHGCGHRAGGAADAVAGRRRLHTRTPPDRGEGGQAQSGYALRCAGDRHRDRGGDDPRRG